jgi:DNA (cytosine-5)-methyltransferase 1
VARVQFLSLYYGGAEHNQSIDEPGATVTTSDHHSFVTAYYGNGFNSDINEPAPTVTTSDRFALVTSKFLANEYSGGGQLGSIEQPNPAVLTTPKQKLISVCQYLMNPQYQSKGGSIDNPCFTLIARMDKMPPYLISTEKGEFGIAVFDDDSHMTRKIKEFMAMYGIIDIKMRMLNIGELKRIMGFPADYTLIGTQAEQKKFIGNAVEVNMSRVLCEALCERLTIK